jgi:hypothetical protein
VEVSAESLPPFVDWAGEECSFCVLVHRKLM